MWRYKFCLRKKVPQKVTFYIPKKDTQQADFLEEYPNFDGRNTVIGIIDSGIVDISYQGMQITTTGLPKVIDCFDFSDDGIVDTSAVVETLESDASPSTLIGLSGRKFNIPLHWKNPSKKWHLGVISFEKLCLLLTSEELDELERKMSEADADKENSIKKINSVSKEEEEKTVDCIVWFDGEKWRACVNASPSENLDSLKILTNFSDEHEYSFLDYKNTISYCVKIENNGNQLQIIVPRFDHGTPVTYAAVAHVPGRPGLDGLAPGAQIISINVQAADTMHKTYRNIKKAFMKLIEIGSIDIINVSLTLNVATGIAQSIKTLAEEHGIAIVIAAGNDGPAFKSIEPYPPFFNYLFVVGSVFTKNMYQRFFKPEECDESFPKVDWYSSKGPSLNTGARGIDFVAPGRGILPHPRWCKITNKPFSGTSLAAPIAAGSIACLISALKANKIQYSFSKIRIALSNTALIPQNDNGLGFGNGIIQIKNAFEFFKASLTKVSSINFASLKDTKTNKMGIFYVHEQKNQSFTNYSFKLNYSTENAINWNFKIFPDSASNFVAHSNTIKDDDNLLSIQINPNSLKPGTLNYAEIRGFDSCNSSLGPIFHLPITVIFPKKVKKMDNFCIQKTIKLNPFSSYSFFFYPPYSSKKCTIQFQSTPQKKNVQIFILCKPGIQRFQKPDAIQLTPEQTTVSCTLPIHQRKQMHEITVYRATEIQHKNNIFDILKLNMELKFAN